MSQVDEQTRLRLLKEIGIDVWLPRSHTASEVQQAGSSTSSAPASSDRPLAHQTQQGIGADSHQPQATNVPADISAQMDELRRAAKEATASTTKITPASDRANSTAAEPPTSSPTSSPTTSAPIDDAAIATFDWPALETAVNQCNRCPLHTSRINPVFGVGNRTAELMIIGEAPGADEDLRGEPFVGRAGQLLDLMLQAIGFNRNQVFIANVLKSRPPNNRNPSTAEAAACLPYLRRQIELVQPKLILAVGKVAISNLLNTEESVGKLRGRQHTYAGVPLIVTYHPAYLLRRPIEKRKSYDDLLFAQQVLAETASDA